MLAAEPGRVFAREQIARRLGRGAAPADARVCDVHVKDLRRKIEDDPARPHRVERRVVLVVRTGSLSCISVDRVEDLLSGEPSTSPPSFPPPFSPTCSACTRPPRPSGCTKPEETGPAGQPSWPAPVLTTHDEYVATVSTPLKVFGMVGKPLLYRFRERRLHRGRQPPSGPRLYRDHPGRHPARRQGRRHRDPRRTPQRETTPR
jgi:hypothetical protein